MYTMYRSPVYDKWSDEQVQFMLLGGNSKAREYFKKHGIDSQPAKVKYSNSFAIQYKEQLKAQVEKMYVYMCFSFYCPYL